MRIPKKAKWAFVVLSTLLVISISVIVFTYISPQKEPVTQKQDSTNTTPIPFQNIKNAMLNGFIEYSFPYTDDDIDIDSVQYFEEKWVIIEATLLNEPMDSEARNMMYVFERHGKDQTQLKLIAFSADGFGDDSFPEGTSKKLIDKVISLW